MVVASYTRKLVKYGEAISIAEQNTQIERFVKDHRMSVSKKYSDRKDNVEAEDGFLEMKEAGLNRTFDCVIFWSFMYLGKDPLNGYNLLRFGFLPVGIDFAVVEDNFLSIGKTTDEIIQYLERKYKERRKAHGLAVAPLAQKARANTLYGYKIVNDDFVIDDAVRPVVERIFSLAVEGKTTREICDWLNSAGIESPQIYLGKEAGKNTDGLSSEWKLPAIKKILTDSRYKGIRKVTKAGVVSFIPIPAYIDESTYDTINGNPTPAKRGAKMENPLFKKVFDKDTQLKMYVGDYMGDGIKRYHISKLTEEARQYKKKAISAEFVWTEAESAMNREHQIAANVQNKLESEEGEQELKRQTQDYEEELHKVFAGMLCAEELFEDDLLHELDKRFAELHERIKQYRAAYSLNNPWIKLYSEMPEQVTLNKDTADKYIEKIEIIRNEAVEFVPKHLEMKRYFPKAWLEPEA
jgi:hypothetical protein